MGLADATSLGSLGHCFVGGTMVLWAGECDSIRSWVRELTISSRAVVHSPVKRIGNLLAPSLYGRTTQ